MTGLIYHAPTDCFVLSPEKLKLASLEIRYAIQKARVLGGFPLEPHERRGPMTEACHLEHTLLSMAERLGIYMGCHRVGKLDVRDVP